MCYKFQPLFLWRDVGLSPISTHAIVASFQLAAALGQILIGHLAGCIGVVAASKPAQSPTVTYTLTPALPRSPGGPAAAILFRTVGSLALAVVIVCEQRVVVIAALLVRRALTNNTSTRRC